MRQTGNNGSVKRGWKISRKGDKFVLEPLGMVIIVE